MDIVRSHTLTTIREEFDEYVLEDGNTLRIKDVIVAFGFSSENPTDLDSDKLKAFIRFNQIVGVIPTGNIDTSGLEPQTNKISEKDRRKKISFKPKNTSLNLYETDEFLIILRSRLNNVWTTPYKDKDEIPIYSINTSIAVDSPAKKSFAVFKDN